MYRRIIVGFDGSEGGEDESPSADCSPIGWAASW